MLTLRQIEVIRAIMITGTVAGAARLLNVSSPGISRVMKHAEGQIGIKLFNRSRGRYTPTRQANDIFAQIDTVYGKLEDLQYVIGRMLRGADTVLGIGSVPSLASVMVPQAVADTLRAYPDLRVEFDVLKIEEAVDYLLLAKGEAVAMSYRLEHPLITFTPLAAGRLKCVVPNDHPLAGRAKVAPAEITRHPLIGIDPNDPYGRIMAQLFAREDLAYDVRIKARFGTTVCALVANGLGIAVIDEFTLAGGNWPQVRILDIDADTTFDTFIAVRKDATPSPHCAHLIAALRTRMEHLRRTGRLPVAAKLT